MSQQHHRRTVLAGLAAVAAAPAGAAVLVEGVGGVMSPITPDATGLAWLKALRLPALPGEKPTQSDWWDHLSTAFPEVRLKSFLEMLGADGGPWRRLCALPALWVGLLYDQGALDAAWDLIKGWDHETREGLRRAAARDGLAVAEASRAQAQASMLKSGATQLDDGTGELNKGADELGGGVDKLATGSQELVAGLN